MEHMGDMKKLVDHTILYQVMITIYHAVINQYMSRVVLPVH